MVAGIDISKDKFDGEVEGGKTFAFDNVPVSLPKLKRALKGVTRVLMEATGTYHLLVAEYLHSEGFEVVVVNPALANFYARFKNRRNKTDKADASILCQMAKDESLGIWSPASRDRKELVGLLRVRDDIVKRRAVKKNQLKNPGITSFEREFYTGELNLVKQSLKRIDNAIQSHIEDSAELSSLAENLMSIPGVGPLAAANLLAHLPPDLTSARQAAAYAGLVPKIVQSGKFFGKTKLSKVGHSGIRRTMYLCAWTAAKKEGPLKEFYERMSSRTNSKQAALCALAHKLIRIAHGVMSSQTKYDPNLLTERM